MAWLKDQLNRIKLYFRGSNEQPRPPELLIVIAIAACTAAWCLPGEMIAFVMLGWFGMIFWALRS